MSQRGFSLVQILVGLALMGITMLGSMSIVQMMNRSQKTQDGRSSYQTLNGAIRSQLLRKESCVTSLLGVPNMTTVAVSTVTPVRVSIPPLTVADGQRLDSYGLTVNFLRLTNYQGFGITNGSRRYHFANLEMSATTDKLSSSQVNGQEDRFQFNKVIVARVIVESDAAGSMLGCYGVDESVNMTQLIESFCGSMGLAMNGSQCLVETKIREVINQGGGCPDGQSFNGFNASGSAICVPRAHLIGSMGGCGGGSFVSGVDGNGSWTCGSPPAPVIPPHPRSILVSVLTEV